MVTGTMDRNYRHAYLMRMPTDGGSLFSKVEKYAQRSSSKHSLLAEICSCLLKRNE